MTHFRSAPEGSTRPDILQGSPLAAWPSEEDLDPLVFRRLVQDWRLLSNLGLRSFGLILIDLSVVRPARNRAQILDAIRRYTRANWIHAVEQGWFGPLEFGILLPNATSDDAQGYVHQMLVSLSRLLSPKCICILDSGRAPQTRRELLPNGVAIEPLARRVVRRPGWIKRFVDLVGATMLLVATAPIMAMIAVAIRLTSPGPILFRQQRVGLGGKSFTMVKFRTMIADAEDIREELAHRNELTGMAFKIWDDPRVTPLGRLLRKLSLDELPQLFNVLRGDMSLVGPRPLPVRDWHPDKAWYTLRHDVRPGITCTWQIRGRYEIPFEEWMRLDLHYVQHHSTLMDLQILFWTIPAVLLRRGAV